MPNIEPIWGVRGYLDDQPYERKGLTLQDANNLALYSFGNLEVFLADLQAFKASWFETVSLIEQRQAEGLIPPDRLERMRKALSIAEAFLPERISVCRN